MPIDNVLNSSEPLELVKDENGVAVTATTPPEPPVLQTPNFGTAEPTALEERAAEFGENIPSTSTGEFIPKDVEEFHQSRDGSASSSVRTGFNEGVFGALLNTDRVSPQEARQLEVETMNYAAKNPVFGTLSNMSGRFASDLPAEALIMMATGGWGVAAKAASAVRSGRSASKLKRSVEAVQEANQAGLLMRTGKVAGVDAMEGAAGGFLSEKLRGELGRGGDINSAVEAAFQDAAIAPIFGGILRGSGKLLGKASDVTRAKFRDAVARDVAEDSVGGHGPDAVDKAEKLIASKIDEAVGNPDAAPPLVNRIDHAEHVAIEAKDARLKTLDDVTNFAERVLPANERHLAPEFARIIESRATALGLKPDEYLKAKKLVGVDESGKVSTAFTDSHTILNAVKAGTPFVDLIHEVGHILRSDLATVRSSKKHLRTLERRYGIEPGQPWTRQAEEDFAADFERALAGDLKVSKQDESAFAKVAEWLARTYSSVIGQGSKLEGSQEVTDIVNKLFIRDKNNVTGAEAIRALEEAETGIRSERVAELGAPERAEISKGTAEHQDDVREIAKAVSSTGGNNIEKTGTAIPRSEMGKKFQRIKQKLGRFLYTDNLSLNMMLRQLGDVGIRINNMLPKAANESARLRAVMMDKYKVFRHNIDDAEFERLHEKSALDIEVREGKDIAKRNLSLSGFEKIKLTMYARDGRGAGKKGGDGQHSARSSLIGKDAGFVHNGKVYQLTRAELDRIAEGSLFSAADAKQLEMVDGLLNTYQSIVKDANKISQEYTGNDVFDTKNKTYNPKSTESGAEVDVLYSTSLAPGLEGKGLVGARTGNATLQLVDPFAEVAGYINSMSHILGHVEFNRSLDTFLEKGATAIKHHLGKDYHASMKDLSKINKGDRSKLGTGMDTLLGKALTIRQLGILSLNPSSFLKQIASGFSAAATKKLPHNGLEISLEAGKLIKSSKDRAAVVEEMNAHSPAWVARQDTGVRIVDLENAGENTAHLTLGKEELRTKDIIGLAKRRGIKPSDAMISQLGRGVKFLKIADEATMAAVWKSAKAQIIKDGIPETDKNYFAKVNELFTSVMMDSQPTSTTPTMSMNQMKTGIGFRAFTQFSRQTRKNFEMMDQIVTTYVNLPKEARTGEARKQLVKDIMPLIYQTAYVTAAGASATGAVTGAVSLVESDAAKRRRARQVNNMAMNLTTRFMKDLFGQVPISGSVLSAMFVSPLGEPVYDISIPVFDEISNIQQGISERNLGKVLKNAGTLSGSPGTVNKFLQSASTNL